MKLRYHLRFFFTYLRIKPWINWMGKSTFLHLKDLLQINTQFGKKVWHFCPIVLNKVFQKWQKNVIDISCGYSILCNENFGRIWMIFDIENWLWKLLKKSWIVSNASEASSFMCGDKLTKREHTLHRLNKPIHDMIF